MVGEDAIQTVIAAQGNALITAVNLLARDEGWT